MRRKIKRRTSSDRCRVVSSVSGKRKGAEHAASGGEQGCLGDERGRRQKRCRTFRKQFLPYTARRFESRPYWDRSRYLLRPPSTSYMFRDTLQKTNGKETTERHRKHAIRKHRDKTHRTSQLDAHTAAEAGGRSASFLQFRKTYDHRSKYNKFIPCVMLCFLRCITTVVGRMTGR